MKKILILIPLSILCFLGYSQQTYFPKYGIDFKQNGWDSIASLGVVTTQVLSDSIKTKVSMLPNGDLGTAFNGAIWVTPNIASLPSDTTGKWAAKGGYIFPSDTSAFMFDRDTAKLANGIRASTPTPTVLDTNALHYVKFANKVNLSDTTLFETKTLANAQLALKVDKANYLIADEFVATSGQTSFTLTNTPQGRVIFFINGIRIPKSSYTISGVTVTYTLGNNDNYAINLGDRINFDY